jgi:hypothetical protein
VDAGQHGLDCNDAGLGVLAQALLASIWQMSLEGAFTPLHHAKLVLKKSKVLCLANAAASACHAPR